MLSFLVVLLIFIFAMANKNTFLAMIFLPSIFFYFLAFELKDSILTSNYFEFNTISDYSLYIFLGFCLIISSFISLSNLPKIKTGISLSLNFWKNNNIFYVPSKLTLNKIYYFFSVFSILAFLINFSRVDFDLSMLFLRPREYELLFGKSTFINYIYFLNVPALCLSIYSNSIKIKLKYSSIINFILIFISFFHGIKFTVFDTFLIPSIFYYHVHRNKKNNILKLLFVFIFLLVFYLIFSFSVRGAYNSSSSFFSVILNYILPNYYNFAFSLEIVPFQFDFITPILPDKLPNPFSDIFFHGYYGFLLNDEFNMATAFSVYYSFFPVLSILFFLPFVVSIRHRILLNLNISPLFRYYFLLTYIDFCLFFSWYFFAFNKTKYIYFVVVIYLMDKFIYRKNIL